MKRLAAAAAASLALAAGADESPLWYLQLDNDVVLATDRWYTSGVRVARVSQQDGYQLEWGAVQEIYTPEAKRFRLNTVDRAPAGMLLLSVARHDPLPTCLQTVELALGVRGPSARGKETTELIHRAIPSRDVDWTREEPDHVAGRLAAVRSHRFDAAAIHYGAVVGSEQAFVHAAAEWKMGVEVMSSLLRYAPTPPPRAGASGWGAFVGAGARAVARDDLLGRSYDYFLEPPQRERVIGRVAAGVGMVRAWGSALFTLVMDSREFEGQRVPHRFGSLVVHLDF